MTKDGGTQRPSPPSSSFSTSTLTLCITVVRLFLIFGLIPEEIALVLRLPSVQSTIVPSRETLRYLQVASAFRHLFPSTSQAYIASSSPPPVLLISIGSMSYLVMSWREWTLFTRSRMLIRGTMISHRWMLSLPIAVRSTTSLDFFPDTRACRSS